MNTQKISAICLIGVLLLGVSTARGQAVDVTGTWEGIMSVSGMELLIVFHISAQPDGTLTATMDSPNQGAMGIKVENVVFEGGKIRLEVLGGAVYEGDLQDDGEAIDGQWIQSGMTFPIVLQRREKAAGAGEGAVEGIAGAWHGTLKGSGIEMRIVFNIFSLPDGGYKATMDSPDQGASGIPVDTVSFAEGKLLMESKVVMGTYEGELDEAETTFTGTWKQGGLTLPLELKRSDKPVEAPRRPQEPKKPYSYIAEEVTYDNAAAKIKLAGTLTRPNGAGPFPAVIMITGSGAQDRDETVFGHKPFWIIADYLTRRGIAVLRVDDRGIGGSTGDMSIATSEDFAGDVLAGIEYLKSRGEINNSQIGLIGHSEGGIIAPMVAVKSSDVAFIILMAGTGITGEEILYLQGALIAEAAGAAAETIAFNRKVQELMFSVVKEESDNTVAEAKIEKGLEKLLNELPAQQKQPIEAALEAQKGQIKSVLSPWFRYFITYDPKPTLTQVKCPVLAINGEKDMQVPPTENLAAIEGALKAGGNKNFKVMELPHLNHLFQFAETGAPTEYAGIEETVSPLALRAMGDWIVMQIGKM